MAGELTPNELAVPLGPDALQVLEAGMRFGRGLTVSATARRVAARAGYTSEDHRELWHLIALGGGSEWLFDSTLDVLANIPDETGARERALLLLRQIDDFENEWFPITQQVLRRFVPAPHTDTIYNAFFHQLSQQPYGPLVIQSVETFLSRYEGLRVNPTPGVDLACRALERRGFTDAARAEVRRQIEEYKRFVEPAGPPPNQAELEAKALEQRAAIERLRLYLNDWGTTLRAKLGYHDAVRLGLVERRGGRKPTSPSTEPTTDADASESDEET